MYVRPDTSTEVNLSAIGNATKKWSTQKTSSAEVYKTVESIKFISSAINQISEMELIARFEVLKAQNADNELYSTSEKQDDSLFKVLDDFEKMVKTATEIISQTAQNSFIPKLSNLERRLKEKRMNNKV